MSRFEQMTRRTFIADLGRATLGIVVLGAAACAGGDNEDDDAAASPAATRTAPLGGWERVNLGFVSAYILVRSGEAFLVDTGVEGKASDIESVLSEAGSSWRELGHLILTHKHPDHIGSASAVVERATEAIIYAGAEDIPSIKLSRDIKSVADGDMVGGLRMIATPGHTPGHMSVLDTASRVLVTGDAVVGDGDKVGLPGEEFTEDMDVAMQSVSKLAGLDFETILFGHGEPITSGGKAKVAELANA